MLSKKMMGSLIVSILLILGLNSSLRPDDPVIVPVKVIGYVAYCEGYLDMMIDVTQGGRKMSGLDVKLNGQSATAITSVSYNYKCVIPGARPAAGDSVKLTIAKPPLVPGTRVVPFITARGTITSLLELIAPMDGDTIPVTAAGVDISYSGGDTPYRLSICKVLPGNRCGRVNFPGCPGMSCTVPMILFETGWSYCFNLFAPIGSITLTGPLHPDSHIVLRQHHSHTITIGASRM